MHKLACASSDTASLIGSATCASELEAARSAACAHVSMADLMAELNDDDSIVITCEKYTSLPSVATRWKDTKTGEHVSGYRLFRQLRSCYFVRENQTLWLYPYNKNTRTFNFDVQLLLRDLEFNGTRNEDFFVIMPGAVPTTGL